MASKSEGIKVFELPNSNAQLTLMLGAIWAMVQIALLNPRRKLAFEVLIKLGKVFAVKR